MTDAEKIAAGLLPLEAERLTGWQGPAGAAFNVISEGLSKRGLLTWDWTLTSLGLEVRAVLERDQD